MKFFLSIIFSLFFIANSFADLADIFWDKSFDIYNQVETDTENNIWDSVDKWVSNIAKKYGIDGDTLKKIINGDIILCNRELLWKLGIKIKKDGIQKEDYKSCQSKLSEEVSSYITTDIISNEVKKTTKLENLLANGKEDDGPYDLMVDVQDLSKVLFKKAWTPKTLSYWKVNIWNNWKGSSSSDWNVSESKDKLKKLEDKLKLEKEKLAETTDPDKKKAIQDDINNLENSIKDTKQKIQNIKDNLKNPELDNTNSSNSNNNNKNPDLQIWQQCWNNIDQSNTKNNSTSWIENNSNNNSNNSSNDNSNLSDNTLDNIDTKKQDSLFDTFNWTGDKWAFIDGIFWLGTWNNWTWNINWSTAWNAPVGWCAWWSDKLLAVCVKMVPSWPNWPVWWTVRVPSIWAAINQIWNTLKDIKQSFIIPAWHGDEALDIDFKHIKFAKIFAFNIVLTKKPVFQFKKDKKAENQKNKAKDTLCEWVPHYLAVKYTREGIADCFSKESWKNKYLIINKFSVWKKSSPKTPLSEKDDNGVSKVIKNYKSLLGTVNKFTTNLDDLMWIWQSSAAALEAKSESK